LAGPEDSGGLVATRPITVTDADGQGVTVGWIALAAPEGGVVTADSVFLAGQFRALILSALLAIVVSAIAAFLLARQFLAPVRTLLRGTEVLAAGDYGTRMANPRQDEFGELIDHFNALAESLEAAERAERQWLSDASHELQTPLAVLRAEIEALQDGVRQPDEKTLSEMNASILRLSNLVGDLNALSHAREGKLLAAMADDDLSAIVKAAAEAARPRLSEAGLSLETGIDGPLAFRCDRGRIRQLVDNLLENARRYTTAPGRVSISLARVGGGLTLIVEDTAPAPPEEAMSKLFDRFYRADASRARQLGGSGLGLAICRAIVVAHGGTIAARRSALGGLAVRVVFPVDEGHAR
jgi:two-component system sensor histidine kinase BaeS